MFENIRSGCFSSRVHQTSDVASDSENFVSLRQIVLGLSVLLRQRATSESWRGFAFWEPLNSRRLSASEPKFWVVEHNEKSVNSIREGLIGYQEMPMATGH